MLDPELVALFWEVAETLGSRDLLEDAGHWDEPSKVIPGLQSVPCSLLPVYHEVKSPCYVLLLP
jgi:hypothetical protein